MPSYQIITPILIVANILISYKGLINHLFFEGYKFEVDKILHRKDYLRLVSSGFLHVSWLHLFFNMFALFAFGMGVEAALGTLPFLLVYFASLVGGNLFCLFIHRQHYDYSSAGASGAICGIIFAFIALFPGASIGFFFLPIGIPSWLYGLGFVLFSIYGIRSNKQNIGHEAHLGGALVGMIVAILLRPDALAYNYVPILCILVPSVIFIYIIVKRPQFLLVDNKFFRANTQFYTVDDRYNWSKNQQQREVDAILEKINRKGMDSLSKSERQKLDEYSRKVR